MVGHVSANLGLGVAARHLTHVIFSRGFPVSVLHIEAGSGRDRHGLTFQAYTVSSARDLPYGANLLLLPSETILGGFDQDSEHRSLLLWEDALNVGIIMWEQMTFPPARVELLTILDVVAAPSDWIGATAAIIRRFCQRSLRGSIVGYYINVTSALRRSAALAWVESDLTVQDVPDEGEP